MLLIFFPEEHYHNTAVKNITVNLNNQYDILQMREIQETQNSENLS
jgi:hypothetical protein